MVVPRCPAPQRHPELCAGCQCHDRARPVGYRRHIRAFRGQGGAAITPHQTYRPFWSAAKLPSGEPAAHLRCDWYVRNAGKLPISIVGAYVGKKAEWHGRVETFAPSSPGELLRVIERGKAVEISCDFWISPPPVEPGAVYVSKVFLQDDLGDRYVIKKLRFDHDGTPARQLATGMVDVLRRGYTRRRPTQANRDRALEPSDAGNGVP